MVTTLLALVVGGLVGSVAGGLLSWRMARRRSLDATGLDPELERQIDTAAAGWAVTHDLPAAAPLIANKLRLTYVLTHRSRRRRRRWSR